MLERSARTLARSLAEDLVLPSARRPDLREEAQRLVDLQEASRQALGEALRGARAPGPGDALLQERDTRLALWGKIAESVQDCAAGLDWPLLPNRRDRLDLGRAQGALVSGAFLRAHRAVNPSPQDLATAKQGAFSDIPLDLAHFVADVHLAYRVKLARRDPRPWSFLDVGCGSGMKVVMASEFFDDPVGLELDPSYVQAARRYVEGAGAHRCRIEQGDARDFADYGAFDVIYFYQPMQDFFGLHALEGRILEQARDDAILIAPYGTFPQRAEKSGFVRLGGDLFMRQTGCADLPALLRETRRIGPHVVSPDEDPPQGLGWLRPLWLACVANGVRPG